jgi:hypothetical protein
LRLTLSLRRGAVGDGKTSINKFLFVFILFGVALVMKTFCRQTNVLKNETPLGKSRNGGQTFLQKNRLRHWKGLGFAILILQKVVLQIFFELNLTRRLVLHKGGREFDA